MYKPIVSKNMHDIPKAKLIFSLNIRPFVCVCGGGQLHLTRR